MKNAANCAKHGELQGFMKPLLVERILRPLLTGMGHAHLRVGEKNWFKHRFSCSSATVHWPAATREGLGAPSVRPVFRPRRPLAPTAPAHWRLWTEFSEAQGAASSFLELAAVLTRRALMHCFGLRDS